MKEVLVELTNRKARLLGEYPYEKFLEATRYRAKGYFFTYAYRAGSWDGYLNLLTKQDTMGAGLFLALRGQLEREAAVRFRVKDKRRPPEFLPLDRPEMARDYQWDCIQKLRQGDAAKTGGLVLGATGAGKTFMAGLYCKGLKGAAVFMVDELTLLKQAQAELAKVLGEEVGEIGNQIFDPKRITVATIQTIHKHRNDPKFRNWKNSLQVMIIDEVHLGLNRSNFESVRAIEPPVVIGLTATLSLRKKDVRLRAWNLAGPTVFEYPLEQGVREGFLSKGLAVVVPVRQLYPYKGLYSLDYQRLIVESGRRLLRTEGLVRTCWKRGKYIIVLVERIQHLKELSRRLADIPHELVYGEKEVHERQESKRKLETGEIRLILTNKVFKKGVDIKRLDVIVDAAGMKSDNDAVQKYGRGVRLCEGKQGLLYFDIADVGNRFEKSAKIRRNALKRAGVKVVMAYVGMDLLRLVKAAERRLSELMEEKAA